MNSQNSRGHVGSEFADKTLCSFRAHAVVRAPSSESFRPATALPRCRYDPRGDVRQYFWFGLANDFTVIELDDAIGEIEVFVVVRDGKDGFAARLQFRQ